MTASSAPQNLDAEEAVIGALLYAGATGGASASSALLAEVRATGLEAGDFYRASHANLWRALLAVDALGEPTEVLAVERELLAASRLEDVGGRVRLAELAALVPATANAAHYATFVIEAAERREEAAVGDALRAAAEEGAGLAADPDLRARVAALANGRRSSRSAAGYCGLSHAELLETDVPASSMLVDGIVEAGTVGTFAGLPETYKSWLALQTAVRVAGVGGAVLSRDIVKTGPVGFWWQDDSRENELRRIQAYARANGFTDALPIRWHLNEGLLLPDGIAALRAEIEREGQILAVLDSLYNFLPPGLKLKDEEVAQVLAQVKADLCDRTGCTVAFVDHAPWPTEANHSRRNYGSVFKTAAIRWRVHLDRDADGTVFVEARGNNLAGLVRTPAVWDTELLELRIVQPPSETGGLADRIDDFLRRNPGAATKVVQAGVQGGDKEIAERLKSDERFVLVPPKLFGKPSNAKCWARAVDVPNLLKEHA